MLSVGLPGRRGEGEVGAWPQGKIMEGKLGERNGEMGVSERPQYRQTEAQRSNGVPTVYTFWQQAKAVRDGRGEVERKEGKIQKYGQRKQPVPEHHRHGCRKGQLGHHNTRQDSVW